MGGAVVHFTRYRILLDNYYLPGDLERQIGTVIECRNHGRYRESIDNLTPAEVYFGRAATLPAERQRIKRQTIVNRRLAASTAGRLNSNPDEP
jgi:RNA-directed DNA polymerase